MAKNLLEMKHITKTFPGVKALDDVNFVVSEGEIHALVGENGAGKSTLMNVLSGYIRLVPMRGTSFMMARNANLRISETVRKKEL